MVWYDPALDNRFRIQLYSEFAEGFFDHCVVKLEIENPERLHNLTFTDSVGNVLKFYRDYDIVKSGTTYGVFWVRLENFSKGTNFIYAYYSSQSFELGDVVRNASSPEEVFDIFVNDRFDNTDLFDLYSAGGMYQAQWITKNELVGYTNASHSSVDGWMSYGYGLMTKDRFTMGSGWIARAIMTSYRNYAGGTEYQITLKIGMPDFSNDGYGFRAFIDDKNRMKYDDGWVTTVSGSVTIQPNRQDYYVLEVFSDFKNYSWDIYFNFSKVEQDLHANEYIHFLEGISVQGSSFLAGRQYPLAFGTDYTSNLSQSEMSQLYLREFLFAKYPSPSISFGSVENYANRRDENILESVSLKSGLEVTAGNINPANSFSLSEDVKKFIIHKLRRVMVFKKIGEGVFESVENFKILSLKWNSINSLDKFSISLPLKSSDFSVGDEILFLKSGRVIFDGVVQYADTSSGRKVVEGVSYGYLLQNPVFGVWNGEEVESILKDVAEQVGLGYVRTTSSGVVISKLVSNGRTAQSIVKDFCDLTGYSWFVKGKTLFLSDGSELSGMSINQSNSILNKKIINPNRIINDVTVVGADKFVTVKDVFFGNGSDYRFALSHKPAQIISCEINSVSIRSADYSVDADNKVLSFKNVPSGASRIVFTYVWNNPPRVEVRDDTSVAEYGLRKSKPLRVKKLVRVEDVKSYADKLLELFKDPSEYYSFTYLSSDWENFKVGDVISVDYPAFGISGNYRIVSVTYSRGVVEVSVGRNYSDLLQSLTSFNERLNQLEQEFESEG